DVKIKRIGKTKDTNDYKIDEGARVLNALKETNWNHQKAAERLGISRTTLWRKIKKYGLKQ
ncbi:MAG: sigma-54-dependent Fis family transcriptional regulator, partial [Spirochaetes bacterium]